ncbi:MAG: hypothetical protein V4650_02705, partial [Pseudomonadota bacterium]
DQVPHDHAPGRVRDVLLAVSEQSSTASIKAVLQKSPALRGFFMRQCLLAATGAALLSRPALLVVLRVCLLASGVVEIAVLGADIAAFLGAIAALHLGWRAAILQTDLVFSRAFGMHALNALTARKLLVALQPATAQHLAFRGGGWRQRDCDAKCGGDGHRTKDHRSSPWLLPRL